MENNLENLTIGVFARTAGVNVETIRFYQRKGLLPEPDKPYGSIRRYGETDVTRVRFVKSAQRLGFSLDEIAELLRLEDGTHCEEASSLAEHKLKDVRERMADLARMAGAHQIRQHGLLDRLVARDIADRSNGGVARLSGALGDRIGDGEDLCGLLIKKQVIVPEVGSGDVPVEIFCLQVNRVAVRQNDLQSVGDSHRRAFVKIRRCRKGGGIVVRHRLDFLNLATRDPAPIPPRMAMYRR